MHCWDEEVLSGTRRLVGRRNNGEGDEGIAEENRGAGGGRRGDIHLIERKSRMHQDVQSVVLSMLVMAHAAFEGAVYRAVLRGA